MSAAQLEQARARLTAYLATEQRILQAQEYSVGSGSSNRRQVRADLETVRSQISALNDEIARLEGSVGGRGRVFYLQPAR
jgi:hypothetical protein